MFNILGIEACNIGWNNNREEKIFTLYFFAQVLRLPPWVVTVTTVTVTTLRN